MNTLVINYYMQNRKISVFISIYASSISVSSLPLLCLNILDRFSEFSEFVRKIQMIGLNFSKLR